MNYEIIKILPEKRSANGNSYIRVEFLDEAKQWFKTDLCRGYRNFQRWVHLLKVGRRITNLQLLDKNSVDADSYPIGVVNPINTEELPECKGCTADAPSHQCRTKQHPYC